MLQNWFRSTGGFRYSLKTPTAQLGTGNSALLRFLNKGPGGRVGYCEQFATAYAVMARTLQIPARVAVGFLAAPSRCQPRRVGLQVARPARLAGAVLPGVGLGALRADAGSPRDHPAGLHGRRCRQALGPEDQPDPGRQGADRQRQRDHQAAAQPDHERLALLRHRHPVDRAAARPRRAGRAGRRRAGPPGRTTLTSYPPSRRRGRGRLGRAARQRGRPRGELARRPVTARDGLPAGRVVRSRAGRSTAGAAPAWARAGPGSRGRARPDRADARARALRASSPGRAGCHGGRRHDLHRGSRARLCTLHAAPGPVAAALAVRWSPPGLGAGRARP